MREVATNIARINGCADEAAVLVIGSPCPARSFSIGSSVELIALRPNGGGCLLTFTGLTSLKLKTMKSFNELRIDSIQDFRYGGFEKRVSCAFVGDGTNVTRTYWMAPKDFRLASDVVGRR